MNTTERPGGLPIRVRRYAGVADHPAMVEVRNAALRANGQPADATVADMDAKYAHLDQSGVAQEIAIVEVGGALVGYARTAPETLGSGARQAATIVLVEPDAPNRAAVADALVAAALDDAGRIVRAERDPASVAILASFPGFDEDARRSVEARGLARLRREGVFVRDSLEHLPGRPVPAGYSLRAVDRDPAVLRAMFEAARAVSTDSTFPVDDASRWFDAVAEATSFDPGLWSFAVRADRPAGLLAGELDGPEDGPLVGWTDVVGVEATENDALTAALLADNLAKLRDAGAASAALGVSLPTPGLGEEMLAGLGYRLTSEIHVHSTRERGVVDSAPHGDDREE